MNNDNNTYEFIDRYFEGDLNNNELQDFQSKLATDEAFAAVFEVEKDLISGIVAFGNQDLKKTLEGIHEEVIVAQPTAIKEAKVLKMSTYRWIALAASFAVLAVVAIWLMQTPSSPQDVFATHYETPAFETLRGSETADLQEIQTFYKNRDFEKTIIAINEYLKNHPENESVRLSLGISYLELGQFDAAIQTFKSLTSSEEVDDQATWYLAMTYLKAGEKDLAKVELQKLVDGTVLVAKQRKLEAEEMLRGL